MLTTLHADCRDALPTLAAGSVQSCITSPPYWGLRDYGAAGQIGLEPTLEDWLTVMVAVFREVRRVLKPDGTLWLNCGDRFAGGGNGGGGSFAKDGIRTPLEGRNKNIAGNKGSRGIHGIFKNKDLFGLPWRLAFALHADGWWLRRDVVWHKPNAMPESVKDRPCTDHEYLFLLCPSEHYYFDHKSIMEPCTGTAKPRGTGVNPKAKSVSGWATGPGAHDTLAHAKPGGAYKGSVPGRRNGPGQERRSSRPRQNASFSAAVSGTVERRHKRSVWSIPTTKFTGNHYATFPKDLALPCVLSSSRPGDTILDPFAGSGTVGEVALDLGRQAILIEIQADYLPLIQERTAQQRLPL